MTPRLFVARPRGPIARHAAVLAALVVAAAADGPPIHGQAPAPSAGVSEGSPSGATVSLVTVGPGNSAVSAFGHSLILFEDVAGDTTAFSFGQSDLGEVGLLVRALQGTIEAGAGQIAWDEAHTAYLEAGRTLWIQRLALLPAQVETLRTELIRTSGFFRYATFHDNCTTMLRDALDTALGGRLRAHTMHLGSGATLRELARPLLRPNAGLEVLATLVLTDRVDGPTSTWEAMFLPGTLRAGVRDLMVPAPDGSLIPLVANETVVGPSPAPAPPPTSIPLWLPALLLGTGLGASMAVLGARSAVDRSAADVFDAVAAGWALTAGLLGLVLVLIGLNPDPVFSLRNENLFHITPLHLGVAVAGWGRNTDRRLAARMAMALLGVSLLGMLSELHGSFDQPNAAIIAFAVPANMGLALGLRSWAAAWPPPVLPSFGTRPASGASGTSAPPP